MTDKTHPAQSIGWVLSGIAALVFYAFLARGDLWFDEIWSLEWVRIAKTPWDFFVTFRHDNNHPLNTLWLWLLGIDASSLAYRGLAAVSGALAVVLLMLLAREFSRAAQWIAGVLAVFSFPMALYFSEARGYAPAATCAIASALLLVRSQFQFTMARSAGLALLSALGMLAHSTFLLAIPALAAWTLGTALRRQRKPIDVLKTLAGWHGLPALLALAWYFAFVRGMEIGGGPQFLPLAVLGHLCGYALGLPRSFPASLLSVLAGAVLLVWIFHRLRGSALRWLLAGSILAPAVVLAFTRPEVLYFRYFFVLLPFFYLTLAVALSQVPRAWMIGWLALYTSLQLPALIRLFELGRGSYSQALEFIARSGAADLTVTADQDFRNALVIRYLLERNPTFNAVEFRAGAKEPAVWHFLHTQDKLQEIPPSRIQLGTKAYVLAGVFPYSEVSGWNWILYRREDSL